LAEGDSGNPEYEYKYEYKQVIVVRTDLAMGKGKLAAQAAHAAVSALKEAEKMRPDWALKWLSEGQPKIVTKVGGLEELLRRYELARSLGLPATLIVDRGLTQLEPGTITCAGIGPAPVNEVDKVTGDLKLLRCRGRERPARWRPTAGVPHRSSCADEDPRSL